jgi:hypothetical protein
LKTSEVSFESHLGRKRTTTGIQVSHAVIGRLGRKDIHFAVQERENSPKRLTLVLEDLFLGAAATEASKRWQLYCCIW